MSSETVSTASAAKVKKTNETRQTLSERSGLILPAGRMLRQMKQKFGNTCRVRATAAIWRAAVLEYLAAEILELSGNTTKKLKKQRITNRHIMLSVGSDSEFTELLGPISLPNSGVYPIGIASALLPKVKGSRATPNGFLPLHASKKKKDEKSEKEKPNKKRKKTSTSKKSKSKEKEKEKPTKKPKKSSKAKSSKKASKKASKKGSMKKMDTDADTNGSSSSSSSANTPVATESSSMI